jgi:hypothetical protein
MLNRITVAGALSALLVTTVATLNASDYDPSGLAGRAFDRVNSAVEYGVGAPRPVRRWVPIVQVIGAAGAELQNCAAIGIVSEDIMGATSYSTSPSDFTKKHVVACFGTADRRDALGTYTSNNVMVDETPNARSNVVGDILPGGEVVFRSAFAGTAQNNLETVTCVGGAQTTPTDAGAPILNGPGTSGVAGSVFLGTPCAIEDGTGGIWVGNSNFTGDTVPPIDVPVAINVWHYVGASLPASTPTYSYVQNPDAFNYANGVVPGLIDVVGDVRLSQPAMARVNGRNYIVFGINDTSNGGSGRPAILTVDAFEDGDAFTGAVSIVAPAGTLFVDHTATGGGASPFEGRHFDINSDGDIVIVAETTASVPSYRLLLYRASYDGTGRIIGYDPPVLIADAGPGDTIADGLGGPIMLDPNLPDPFINAISGAGINDRGNIAFSATYVPDPNDPNTLSTAAYFYHAGSGTLHRVLSEGDVIMRSGSADAFAVGLIPQEGGDSVFGCSLADDADVMAVTYDDDSPGGYLGTVVLAIGHIGDSSFNYVCSNEDLQDVLDAWASAFGTATYDPEVDFNLDGIVENADLQAVLDCWAQTLP